MHNHNDKEEGGSGMMWMMISCLLLIGVLFLGGGNLLGGGYLGPVLIGSLVVVHIWMMFRGHGKHTDASMDGQINNASVKREGAGGHKHSGSCH